MSKIKILLLEVIVFINFFVNAAPIQENNSIRLMSYNIRNGRGMDNITDYNRIADIINKVNPDVIALQELDSVTNRSGGIDVLDILSGKTLRHATYAAAIDYDGGKYGVGILSKEKPLSVRKIKLPGGEEERILLIVELNEYYFGCTHLSLNAEDRLKSVEIIMGEAEKLDKPFFLAGDMNSLPESQEQKYLNESFVKLNLYKENTFPSDNPSICIDYIYGYRGTENWSRLTYRGVISEKVASDHLPLYVEVRLHSDINDTLKMLQ